MSDWISDVCSSDLQTPIGNLLYSLGPRFFDRPYRPAPDQARRAPAGLGPAGYDQGQGDMVGRRSATAVKLGRAPVRGRVCKDVYNSVDDGTLQKKHKTQQR